ncbi:hypothetical protein ACH5RR_026063 [Cinchona calisaya]|uniref:Uncharacterized protein n=1 Tax=Cinchona calisaya TaxID=153742 RepID=A0ABD2Z1T1_9GENT
MVDSLMSVKIDSVPLPGPRVVDLSDHSRAFIGMVDDSVAVVQVNTGAALIDNVHLPYTNVQRQGILEFVVLDVRRLR